MEVMPILSTLRRNKVGAMLVALQIALTLAVVANALAVIQRHWTDMTRPSGLDEANIFSMANQWVGQPDDLAARIETDMAALRALPGVVDAEATNSFPLSGRSWVWGASVKSHQATESAQTSVYFDTVHGLAAQGLRLAVGRWFTPDEVIEFKTNEIKSTPSVVLSAALAKRLFPDGQALGRSVYVTGDEPERVVGIVERATSASGTGMEYVEFSTFVPGQLVNSQLLYLVRTKPGQQQAVMRGAKQRLLEISRLRILNAVEPFSDSRTNLFAVAAATNWLLATVCALLLVITACGTVGLTMLWVAQRRRQIGMRRALGARRIDILRYFHTENLLISAAGALLGIATGLGANLWFAKHLAMTRMSPVYIVAGALVVLLLSQLAVLWPALRAATVPPSLAARGL
ncbi:MAG TPA: FtsX-like permease family protein [Steroidobacteraceae bacterium]|jgi:putative ABC transport system permease protein